MIRRRFCLSTILVIAFFALPVQARAAEAKKPYVPHPDIKEVHQYDPTLKFKPHPGYPDLTPKWVAEQDGQIPSWLKRVEAGDRVVPLVVNASLISDPQNPQNNVILRLELPQTLQTCMRLGPLEYSKEIASKVYLDITVKGMEVTEVEPVNGACAAESIRPTADIVLSRDELQGIRQIRFLSNFEIDYYNVELGPNSVELQAMPSEKKTVRPLQDPRVRDPLKAWFYPADTVILFVPKDTSGRDLTSEVQGFAASRGLTPIEQLVPGFETGLRDAQAWYFVDNTGRIASSVRQDPVGNPVPVGYVTATKTVRDVSGPRQMPVRLDVFARLPAGYE